MAEAWTYIGRIEKTAGRLEKQAICEEALRNCPEFFEGARWAYGRGITFGIKNIPPVSGLHGTGLPWEEFQEALRQLSNRMVTGDAARALVHHLQSRASLEQWHYWYHRILIRDFRAGITEGTINRAAEAIGALKVDKFKLQLAHHVDDHGDKMVGVKWGEVKGDGVRCLAFIYSDGRVELFSRPGKQFLNFPHIEEQLRAMCPLVGDIVLDGEIVSEKFYKLMRQVHRKTDADASDATYMVFDAVPMAAFRAGLCAEPLRERKARLQAIVGDLQHLMAAVEVIPHEEFDLATPEGQDFYRGFMERCCAAGFEGAMYKDPEAPYMCKRTVAWLKAKPTIQVTVEITGCYPGDAGKQFENSLGGFHYRGHDMDRNLEGNCGGGFSVDERAAIWKAFNECPESLIGQLAEIEADGFTESDKRPGIYNLRFPRFLRFRGFEIGDKL